jgi:RNA polymerase sigma factor (sigma-70 family)
MAISERPAPAASFDELLEGVAPRLKRMLARYRVPSEDAEDLLQQTFLALVYQWDCIHDPEPWLLGTLKNHCLMYLRKRDRRLESAVDSALLEVLAPPVAPPQERAARLSDLRNLLRCLPCRYRRLLQLRYEFGYEPPEVAARLGYRTSSIGKITARCLRALSRELLASATGSDAEASSASREGCPRVPGAPLTPSRRR